MDPDPAGFDLFAPDPFDAAFTVMPVLIGLFVVAFVVVAIVGVVMSVRRARRLKDAGLDPLDPQTDLTIRLAQSQFLAPSQAPGRTPGLGSATADDQGDQRRASAVGSLERRLADLDALHRAGTISTAERDAARAKLLGTL